MTAKEIEARIAQLTAEIEAEQPQAVLYATALKAAETAMIAIRQREGAIIALREVLASQPKVPLPRAHKSRRRG